MMLKKISGSKVAFKSISLSVTSTMGPRKTYSYVLFVIALLGPFTGKWRDNVSGGRLELYLLLSEYTAMFSTEGELPAYLIIAPTMRPLFNNK